MIRGAVHRPRRLHSDPGLRRPPAGDWTIQHAAVQIFCTTRVQDTVVPLGGDEVEVVYKNIAAEDIDTIAGRIVKAIRTSILIGRCGRWPCRHRSASPARTPASVRVAVLTRRMQRCTGEGRGAEPHFQVSPDACIKAQSSVYEADNGANDRSFSRREQNSFIPCDCQLLPRTVAGVGGSLFSMWLFAHFLYSRTLCSPTTVKPV